MVALSLFSTKGRLGWIVLRDIVYTFENSIRELRDEGTLGMGLSRTL